MIRLGIVVIVLSKYHGPYYIIFIHISWIVIILYNIMFIVLIHER